MLLYDDALDNRGRGSRSSGLGSCTLARRRRSVAGGFAADGFLGSLFGGGFGLRSLCRRGLFLGSSLGHGS